MGGVQLFTTAAAKRLLLLERVMCPQKRTREQLVIKAVYEGQDVFV